MPAHARGERVLVIAEEWQTANVAIAIDRLARERGVRAGLTLMWNANNTYGFEKIHWPTLTRAAAVTAVSKYMKFELAQWGVHALVIPNGIDPALLDGADPERPKRCAKRSATVRRASKSAASIPTRTGSRRSTRSPTCARPASTRA